MAWQDLILTELEKYPNKLEGQDGFNGPKNSQINFASWG